MSIKIPLTPAGIEPATFRIVEHHLNHCATAIPYSNIIIIIIIIIIKFQNKISKIFNMFKKYLGDNDPAVHGPVNKISLLNSSLYFFASNRNEYQEYFLGVKAADA